jgi:hypothetical protein
VRGELLARLGRLDEARAEFERAASLTQNARERTLLLERAAASRSESSFEPHALESFHRAVHDPLEGRS